LNKSRLLGAVCACVLPLCIASPVNAAFVLTIDDLSNGSGVDITVLDGDADGVITYNSALGVFSVLVTTGVSKPTINGPQLLDLNSIEVSGGAGSLIFALTDTDYSGSPAALRGIFSGTVPTGGSMDFDFLYDSNNTEFGGTSFYNPGLDSTNPIGGIGTGIPDVPSATYSLTIIAKVNHPGGSPTEVSSFDAEISAVPVPAAVWLFGSGLLGLIGMARRKKAA